MRREESGVLPVWCPFYREDSGKSIFCEGITDESFLRLTSWSVTSPEVVVRFRS